ncbi:MAG: orotate phosphoribosyltransferase [Candidatus Cloacimonetes bacterium]|nr:orotate phosphoribosyltransferase [Candidatus Cloacimonadota bacterium]
MSFTVIRRFGTDVEANLALGLLRTNGIEAHLNDEHLVSDAPGFAGMLGGIKLVVPADREIEARALLDEYVAIDEDTLAAADDSQVEIMLREAGALLTGHFKLTSGRHSDAYVEKIRLINQPQMVVKLCAMLAARMRHIESDVVVGPAMGGIVLAYEVAKALGRRFVFSQRFDGRMGVRSGFPLKQGNRAIIIEDITTTGGSIVEVIDCLRERGVEVAGVGLIVDRSGGAIDFDVPTFALLSLDIQSWEPSDCPLCASKQPITKPGSSDK